jgi:hypothetical protein
MNDLKQRGDLSPLNGNHQFMAYADDVNLLGKT